MLQIHSMPVNGVTFSMIWVVFLTNLLVCRALSLPHVSALLCSWFLLVYNPFSPSPANESVSAMVPQIQAGKMEMRVMNESRRRLGSFQICGLCTCCGGANGVCLPSPCCYAINCNIPNRPFGFCSFTPKTCNCFGCHI